MINNNTQNKILIGLPVYNEFDYVEEVLHDVCKYAKDILVVDDGSTDGTSEKLKQFPWIDVITHNGNKGYGKSLIDIFDYAQMHGYQWVITMDCDHQHKASCLSKFYEAIPKNHGDIISGSRYLHEDLSTCDIPKERYEINLYVTKLLNSILSLSLTDAFCGFKAYRVEALKKLNLTDEGYGLPLELWIQAANLDLFIQEIPVPLIYHDPNRNFAGKLENAKFRLNYYMDIIEKNLLLYGYANIK